MSAPKLTEWFPADMTPARDGVYQVLIRGTLKYSRWRGDRWCLALANFGSAKQSRIRSTDCYIGNKFTGWRGLAANPKEQS